MRHLVALLVCLVPSFAMAQWAVYDDAVLVEIRKINETVRLDLNANLDSDFKGTISNSSSGQDVTLGAGSNQAVLKGIDTKFGSEISQALQRLRGFEKSAIANSQTKSGHAQGVEQAA